MGPYPIDGSLAGMKWTTRRVGGWTPEDVVTFAVACGAEPEHDLDYLLVSRGPKVLPFFSTAISGKNQSWGVPPEQRPLGVVERVVGEGESLLYLRSTSRWVKPLAPSFTPSPDDTSESHCEIAHVWDKGSAAVLEYRWTSYEDGVEIGSGADYFMLPGRGGFGGDRGPSRYVGPTEFEDETLLSVPATSSYLYQLIGDRTDHNVDPKAAADMGFPAPFAPGAISQAVAARGITKRYADGDHTALGEMSVDFGAPHFPGEPLMLHSTQTSDGEILFALRAADREILSNGRARLR